MAVTISVLHYVENVEDVSLVLQSGTLFQLPHQRRKVCIALRVSRQVQISSTVELVRDVGVRQMYFRVKSQEKQSLFLEGSAVPTLCCFACEQC